MNDKNLITTEDIKHINDEMEVKQKTGQWLNCKTCEDILKR